MKLYLKRDTSMEHTRFIVCDHRGDLRYVVTGKRSGSVDRMVISLPDSTMLMNLKIAPMHFLYVFVMSGNNHRVSMFSSNPGKACEFRFHGIDWTMCRSSDMRSFEIIDSRGISVMLQSADTFLKSSAYTLDIFDEANELYCVAAAICADVISYADSHVAATV